MKKFDLEEPLKYFRGLINIQHSLVAQMLTTSIELRLDTTELIAQHIGKDFLFFINKFGKQNSIEETISLFDHIGVDPIKFAETMGSKYDIRLFTKSYEDLEYFTSYAQSKFSETSCRHPFELIEKISHNSALFLLSLWSTGESKDIEKFSFLWKTANPYLHSVILQSPSLDSSDHNPELTTLELLERLSRNKANKNEPLYKFKNENLAEKDILSILKLASYIELEEKIDNNGIVKPKKIKI